MGAPPHTPANPPPTLADLTERESRLRSYFESPTVGLAVTSPDKGWLEINPATERMLGYTLAELRGKTWADITHPEDVGADVSEFDRVVAGTSSGYTLDKRYVRKDGSILWASISVSCVREPDGRIAYFVALLSDISERKRVEQALRASEARFRALAEASPVGIFETDPAGSGVYLNRAASEILGMDLARARGAGWMDAVHPEDREKVSRAWAETLASGETYVQEHRYVRPGGDVVVARVYANPLHAPDGSASGFVGVMIDVTELRETERRLAVSSRLAAMGTLVAGVGHEINNPLAAMMAGEGFVLDVLTDLDAGFSSGSPPPPDRVASEIASTLEPLREGLESGRRIAQIVKDLSVFGKQQGSGERVRLRDVVEAGLRWVPVSTRGTARVEVEDAGAPEVVGLRGQLSQVVLNLVTNALLAGRPGRPPQVLVRIGPGRSGTARLEVRDDGVGMSPETVHRIFDPFFTTRPSGERRGSGLGLSVCQAIVAAHGGSITVDSEPGRGSTFTVELPAA